MAKYNLSRYNLAKYNRSVDADIVFDKLTASSMFQAFIGLGQTTKDVLRIDSAFSGFANIASGTLDVSKYETIFGSEIICKFVAYGHEILSDALTFEGYLSPFVNDKLTMTSEFSAISYLAPDVKDVLAVGSEFDCESYLGNVMIDPEPIMAYAIFGAAVSAETYEEIVMNLDCTIPAGGVLTIDSDNFRVLLNSQNAIKYHSGDWIDELNRQSISITIESGGSTLNSTIYFQELWL